MANNNTGQASAGIGLPGLLLVLFVGLKLTNQIDWSWVWVLSPIWITVTFVMLLATFAAISASPTNYR